jgi:hypothetical protein
VTPQCAYCNTPIVGRCAARGFHGEPVRFYHLPCYDRLRDQMSEVPHNDKYGRLRPSKGSFGNDEPVFVVRGADPLAVPIIIEYARRAQEAGSPLSDHAFDHAMRTAEWQRENPEKVKAVPD